MTIKYDVAIGGFLQDAPHRYVFEISGELTVPVAFIVPSQFVRHPTTLSSAKAVFMTAGTSTYTITVTTTNLNAGGLQTLINSQTITPLSGEAVDVTFAATNLAAQRIIGMSIVQNSGTPSSGFTLTLE